MIGEKGGGMVNIAGMENSRGHGYLIRPYCTTQKGTTLYLYTYCILQTEGIKGPCYGKTYCAGGDGFDYEGSTPCKCDSSYVDVCNETCKVEGLSANGGFCSIYGGVGYFYLKEKCKTSKGISVNYYAPCNGLDCEGNKGPCYGKKVCGSGTIAIDPCTCGGVTLGSSCVIKCPYEDTETSCAVHGRSFKQRCKDNNGTWYGECI